MEPPSQIIVSYIEQSANIVHNDASHLLENCTLLTNKRTVLSYPNIIVLLIYVCAYNFQIVDCDSGNFSPCYIATCIFPSPSPSLIVQQGSSDC